MINLQTQNWEVLDHPVYNPDLPLSDFHLFGSLMEAMRVWGLAEDEVQEAVHDCLLTQQVIPLPSKSLQTKGKQYWVAEELIHKQCSPKVLGLIFLKIEYTWERHTFLYSK